ncbi:MAG: class I SAM-dependent methyltransferase [Verrucomicrobia bacterium]|nr:class I SAM-dependent methyltransferase [Verrucomicrobiota bacterium]
MASTPPSPASASGAHEPKAPAHVPYQLDLTNRFHWYENHWKRVALELLLKHCRPHGQTILDYGCGRGETLDIYKKAGFDVTGTDTDPECVRLASQYGEARLLEPERAVDQFGRKSFNIVTCFHVLEHVPCPKQTLSDISAIARDYALIAVPNLRQLRWIGARKIDLSWVNEGHLQSWDHWHFLGLAQRYCGLELVEWGFDATILPGISELAARIGGNNLAIRLETGLFRRMFPFHGISVLGLFRVRR